MYTAVNATTARAAFDDLAEAWGPLRGDRAVVGQRLGRVHRSSSTTTFLDHDVEIRRVLCSTNRVLCSTNAIESLNARYRRAIKARGHFPSEQAALKGLYLVTRSLDPPGTGQTRWTTRWKPALNASAITIGDRFPAAETH